MRLQPIKPHQARQGLSWLLVLFALTLLSTIASPFIQARALDSICSVSATAASDDATALDGGAPDAETHGLHCALCLPWLAMPSQPAGLALPRFEAPTWQAAAEVDDVAQRPLPLPPLRGPPLLD